MPRRTRRKESHNILWLKNGVAALVEHIAKGGDGPATPSQVNAVRVRQLEQPPNYLIII